MRITIGIPSGKEGQQKTGPKPAACPFSADELRALYGTPDAPGPAPSLVKLGRAAAEAAGRDRPFSNVIARRWLVDAGITLHERGDQRFNPRETKLAAAALGRAELRRRKEAGLPAPGPRASSWETRRCENPACGREVTRHKSRFGVHTYCGSRCLGQVTGARRSARALLRRDGADPETPLKLVTCAGCGRPFARPVGSGETLCRWAGGPGCG